MEVAVRFKRVILKNEDAKGLVVYKKEYTVIKTILEQNDRELIEKIKKDAKALAGMVNTGAANGTNTDREFSIRYKDALSGLLAEYACRTAINRYIGSECAYATECNDSRKQIDIMLKNRKTIEVRSSCMRNGVVFSLFNKNKNGDQYFDVLGPYHADYKPHEPKKDYYMRVLYPIDKKYMDKFSDDFDKFEMYLVGGATWDMMCDKDIFRLKKLTPDNSDVDEEGNYRVIPIHKGLEIFTLLERIKKEL